MKLWNSLLALLLTLSLARADDQLVLAQASQAILQRHADYAQWQMSGEHCCDQ